MDIGQLLNGYDLQHLTIGVLGGHSALDVAHGVKQCGLRTVCVAQKGREAVYTRYYRARQRDESEVGCVDAVIVVDKFSDVLKDEHQAALRKMNTVFVHNRYFWVYFDDFGRVEDAFRVPFFGSRHLLKLEERFQTFNQYDVLKLAGIRTPKLFDRPEDIDRLVLVKASEAARTYERAFFVADSYASFKKTEHEQLDRGHVTQEGMSNAVIEEYIIGAPVNFNFFYSPLTGELELMGTDTRRQTNLDGLLRMTAPEQLTALEHGHIPLKMIETGHIAVTVKESLLTKAFELGERFVAATKKVPKNIDPSGKGIIGPFALQGAVVAEEGKEDIVIFDVSFRIPGSPGTASTPYSGYLYGQSMSVGERIGLELQTAVKQERLQEVVT